ncbi:hypothetical protein [Deinococcus soli (ex Cha et al. 2016)]|uniref:hypothetical protein n=1 Tax=Deinococcus soli (ex Cha et al. 2016) TaxID=1309411 RepID=UPI001663C700|nr:hypothetical protein [Deinococcus soli (ex Cha et al. 2016)]GGB70968.1 hypothetical protein GCM10008019_28950 [Deinococcus soli (ex Cha et al. 2016)]
MKRLLLILPLLLAACTPPRTPDPQPRVRVTATTTSERLDLAVTLEGADGQALSGALAQVKDPGGALNLLPYASSKGAYVATLPAVSGTYHVTVDSAAAGALSADVPVTVLTRAPDLQDVQDGNGQRIRNFERVSAQTPIRVTWTATPGADRYLLEVRQLGRLVATVTTTDTSAVLPAGTLTGAALPGSPASVTVTASAQQGDPAYRSARYLSSSTLSAPSLGFQVVP